MSKKHLRRKIGIGFLLLVAAGAVFISMKLEGWVKDYVNQQINALDGYSGGIDDVDLYLWRGAYEIEGLIVEKDSGGLKEPFVTIQSIDLSIQWRALLNGKMVAEIDLYKPDVKFAKSQTGEDTDWLSFVKSLTPFDINRFETHKGKVSYIDYVADPNIYLYVSSLNAKVTNISNVQKNKNALPSNINIYGSTIGGGKLSIEGGMNALKETPDFDLALKMENADLPYFNDYFRKYAALDFEKGDVSVFGELASVDGQVSGYIKPIATNVDLVSLKNDSNPFNLIWESLASVFIEIFENQPKDQFALRIPINGDLSNPDQNTWLGFLSIFSNAFNGAFSKDVDGTIDLKSVIDSNN